MAEDIYYVKEFGLTDHNGLKRWLDEEYASGHAFHSTIPLAGGFAYLAVTERLNVQERRSGQRALPEE